MELEPLFDKNQVTVIAADGYVTIDNANPPDDFSLATNTRADTPENRKIMLSMANKWSSENALK